MSEPDVTKGKKAGGHKCPKCGTRHQSVRQYVNRNKPIVAPPPDWLPDDDGMVAEPDEVKGTMGNAHQPDGRDLSAARLSPSRVQGNASPAQDDHGAALPPGYVPGPRETAWMHPDMRQGTVDPVPLLSMRTDANPHPRDLSGAAGVTIALSRLDAYSAAGAPVFREQPSGNPAMRGLPRIAPAGSGSNGGHSLSDPQSHAVAMKNSDRLAIIKNAMFGNGAR